MKLLISSFLFLFTLFGNDLKDITSYEASFTQTIVNSSNKEIIYNGYLYIQQPSSIVWKYTDPIEKNVYIVNTKVTIIEPDLEQVIISKIEKEVNILELIKNASKIKKHTYLSSINGRDYKLTIIDNVLQQINYKDEVDNNITIRFTNSKQNHFIDKKIFQISIPYEYDIIRK